MFETATRQKLRFTTVQGLATVEDLWDLPLTSKNKASLDGAARTIAKDLREAGEESFVEASTANTTLELKLAIVKQIIATKLEERDTRKNASDKQERNATIMAIIAKKQNAALEDKSIDELMAEMG